MLQLLEFYCVSHNLEDLRSRGETTLVPNGSTVYDP